MNASGVPILAVDVPSGLDCDTGAAAKHTIRAAHTCTFVAAKPGFYAPAQRSTWGSCTCWISAHPQADRRRRIVAAALRSVCNVDEKRHWASFRGAFHLDLIARFCDKSPLFLAGSAAV